MTKLQDYITWLAYSFKLRPKESLPWFWERTEQKQTHVTNGRVMYSREWCLNTLRRYEADDSRMTAEYPLNPLMNSDARISVFLFCFALFFFFWYQHTLIFNPWHEYSFGNVVSAKFSLVLYFLRTSTSTFTLRHPNSGNYLKQHGNYTKPDVKQGSYFSGTSKRRTNAGRTTWTYT